MTSAQPATGVIRRFEYDENGNQTREYIDNTSPTPDADVRTFAYNAEGMTEQLVEGVTSIDYTYGGAGELVGKDDTVYVGGVYEKDTATGVVTKYYFFGGERIAMREGSTLSFLTNDQLGGTALITNTAGAMVSRIRYYPYGGIRTQEGAAPATDKLYTGQQQETGDIYHYNARMYNTDIGRMPQADSVIPEASNPQAYNRYSYVVGNPINHVDPTGRAYCDVSREVAAGFGPHRPGEIDIDTRLTMSCSRDVTLAGIALLVHGYHNGNWNILYGSDVNACSVKPRLGLPIPIGAPGNNCGIPGNSTWRSVRVPAQFVFAVSYCVIYQFGIFIQSGCNSHTYLTNGSGGVGPQPLRSFLFNYFIGIIRRNAGI